jgi:(2Fe-2S) ferredoxin
MLEELEKHGLGEEVAVTGCHCPGPGVGTCERGPMVIVYPDGVWYANVRADDVAEIVESHVAHGKPVERLMYKE